MYVSMYVDVSVLFVRKEGSPIYLNSAVAHQTAEVETRHGCTDSSDWKPQTLACTGAWRSPNTCQQRAYEPQIRARARCTARAKLHAYTP